MPENASQEFLDSHQYTVDGILKYEFIFGEGFISTGGIESTQTITQDLVLKENDSVIDVGCGIGGGCAFLEKKYKAKVLGIDLSQNVVKIANEKYATNSNLQFEVQDALTFDVPSKSQSLVYSRDTILHIHEKPKLFAKFYDWLKPGGQLLITDYCAAPKADWDEEFKSYVASRNYDLHTVAEYAAMLEAAEFDIVKAEDATIMFLDILKSELKRIETRKEKFLTKFSDADYEGLVTGWKDKVKRAEKGIQRWGIFLATKK